MNLLQMTLSGALFIIAVMVIRAIAIHKLPKITFLVLWYIALLRLLLPVTFQLPSNIHAALYRHIPVLETFESILSGFVARLLQNPSAGTGSEVISGGQTMQPVQTIQPVQTSQVAQFTQPVQTAQTIQDVWESILSNPVFLTIWAVGLIAMTGFFLVSYFGCKREFRTSLPVQNDVIILWCREHPLWRTMDIRQLTGLSTPLAYGVFHPVILMPKNTDWDDRRQVQYVLFHEYVHIRRFDAVGKLIASAALCIHWFNPLVWILYALFNRDIELSCDECVIRHFGVKRRKDYAMALLYMEEQRSSLPPLSNCFKKNATEERIKAIMKFKKKTNITLAFALIIIVLGVVCAFAMAPETAVTDWEDILLGTSEFLYISDGTAEPTNIQNVPALFDPDDDYMKIWSFAVQDLDGDQTGEVILSVFGAAGDTGGSLVLYQTGGKTYGYSVSSSAFTDLKTDGTYNFFDPTGAMEGGICSFSAFTQTGYTIDKITYGHGAYGVWDTFVVNHQTATEEEYLAAMDLQAAKTNAVWHDFTAENIAAIQGAGTTPKENAGQELYAGVYNDYDVNEPNLIIEKKEDGTYNIQIGIYRLVNMDDGVGTLTEEGISFTVTAPNGKAIGGTITLDEDIATVTFDSAEWSEYSTVNEYRYYKTPGNVDNK